MLKLVQLQSQSPPRQTPIDVFDSVDVDEALVVCLHKECYPVMYALKYLIPSTTARHSFCTVSYRLSLGSSFLEKYMTWCSSLLSFT